MSITDHWAIIYQCGIILESTEKTIKDEWDKIRSGQPNILPKSMLLYGLKLAEIHDQITIRPEGSL